MFSKGKTVKRIIILVLFLASPSYAASSHGLLEGGFGFGGKNSVAVFSYERSLFGGFELLADLSIQAGLKSRLVHLVGDDLKYQTAGSGDRKKGPIESVTVKNSKHTAVNQGFFVELASSYYPIVAGFDLDLLGYTFAAKNSSEDVKLEAGGWNVFRWAYNDLGTLHSEIYLGVKHGQYVFKVGTSHSSTQYRVVEHSGTLQTSRLLNFSDTFFLAAGFGI